MAELTSGRPDEGESTGYHSAVEVDEDYDNWRDWVGPGLAILFVVAAIVGLVLTVGGHI